MFEILTDYQKTNIFVQSPVSEFKLLSSLNKQLYNLVYNSFYSENIFKERSQIEFSNDLIEYRKSSREPMKWKDFYRRIVWYKRNVVEENMNSRTIITPNLMILHNLDNHFNIFLKRLVMSNKIMELKILYSTVVNKVLFRNFVAMHAGSHSEYYVIKWLISLKLDNDTELEELKERVLVYAASRGNYHLVKKLHSRGWKIRDIVVHGAICSGNIEFLDWIYSLGEFNNYIDINVSIKTIIQKQDLKTLTWLCEHRMDLPNRYSFCYKILAKKGNIEMFKFLYYKGIRPTEELLKLALDNKHNELVEWMTDKIVAK